MSAAPGPHEGVLTANEVARLARWEATLLGLEWDEAVRLTRANGLPTTPLGTELRFLIRLLDAPE